MFSRILKKSINKYTIALGISLFVLGFYFTVITNPWVTFCPGTQSSQMSTVDPTLAKKFHPA